MKDWTSHPWKVLGLGVVASVIATYVVRLLDAAAVATWDKTSQLITQAEAHPGRALMQVITYVVLTGVLLKLSLMRDRARARFLADVRSVTERHAPTPTPAPHGQP